VIGGAAHAGRTVPAKTAHLETVVTDLLDGQYSNPLKVVAFNTAEGWSRDVSEDIAHELRRRSDMQLTDLPDCVVKFVVQHERKSQDRAQAD
jgi:hypothetical protein